MRNLLLTASAIACIGLPTLGLAQDRDDHATRDHPVQHEMHHDDRNGGGPDTHHDDHNGGRPDTHHDDHSGGRPDDRHDGRSGFNPGRPGFDGGHAWNPGNRFWWRGRPEFAGYGGARPGFWFIPGRGYVNPGPMWFGYGWRVGGFVPLALRGYGVADPYVYGLPRAPYGFRYIYLGNNVALMHVGNGRIVRMVPNVY